MMHGPTSSPAVRGRRLSTAFLLLALVAATASVLLAPSARADEERTGTMTVSAVLEPATLAPGESGHVVINAVLPSKLHIYAADTNGNLPLTWEPIPSAGVTYDTEGADVTKPHDYTDPYFPDEPPYPVFEGAIQIRLPITLGEDVVAGTRVGVTLSYTGCDDQQCYPRVEGQIAATTLPVGAAGVADPGPAPAPGEDEGEGEAAGEGGAEGDEAEGPVLTTSQLGGMGTRVWITLNEDEDVLTVHFEPPLGWHLYLPPQGIDGIPLDVQPVEAEGVTWGEFEIPFGDHQYDPLDIPIPFEREPDATLVQVRVSWQACADEDGSCGAEEERVFGITWDDPALVETPDEPELPVGDLQFPVIKGDDLSVAAADEGGDLASSGWLALFPIFLVGALLALTPCVLPIIPITVSVVAGGATEMPKSRLFKLLGFFSLGLGVTYGILGLASAFLGQSISVIFNYPLVLWGFVLFFAAMALSMMGLFEIKPPEFMTKFQGSAQEKGGSVFGAIALGAMMSVLSTPCTGPFVIGLATQTAKLGDPVMGFFAFFALGLGMSSVFFLVAGSLGAFLKPGPWMVWIRYGFAVALYGAAVYYIGSNDLVGPTLQWILALAGVAVSWILVFRHLTHLEGEEPPAARARATILCACLLIGAAVAAMFSRRAAQDMHGMEITASLVLGGLSVALLIVLIKMRSAPAAKRILPAAIMAACAAGLVFTTTQPFDRPPPPKYDIAFEDVMSLEELKQRVAESKALGRPVVMEVSARGCTYCRYYQSLIHDDTSLHERWNQVTRLHLYLNHSDTEFSEVYDAIGQQRGLRPLIVFWDREGRIRDAATVSRWFGDESATALRERLDLVLGNPDNS